MTRCVRCIVSGKVQGVWFRGSTRQQAIARGITGRARNLPDGSVEVIACGPAAALESLKSWLWEGPPMARVDHVVCEPVSMATPSGFTTD